MATMAPRAFRRLVLVGAMGLKPAEGEILDQALVSYIEYVRAGFADQARFDALFGPDPATAQLEQWDLNREMTFRIAWKPYMYNPTLAPLLEGVQTPALIVWGGRDRIVPPGVAQQFGRALPTSRVTVLDGAGHFVDMEQPDTLAKLITQFVES
jgi:pimeloyl-ACP methyl ester carboxylesterase